MEASVKTAEVLLPPQADVAAVSSPDADVTGGEAAAVPAVSVFLDPMEEFSKRLEDIINTYGAAAGVPDDQSAEDNKEAEAKEDFTVAMETEVDLIRQTLSQFSSPQDKLEDLLRRLAELAVLRRCDERQLCVLQAERHRSVAARGELETLCRDLQRHYRVLQEDALRRCREDEEKRTEMVGHFQTKLVEIQAQIEQHSARNDKLCHENANLTDKLEGLMNQCELREESLEKINKRRDLQQKLTEAKLQQANALLADGEEKHKREKEYLLVQAAEWKLQAQTLREQAAGMQAQLTLYAQKFDEFQETLAKSNQIYTRFKKEMDNMSEKMKKMDKESNLWKTRFENCNKALTTMIEERAEKNKEYDLFVLKIQKLEKLCRVLQDERAVLYDKIKEVRQVNSNVPSMALGKDDGTPDTEGADQSDPVTLVELQEEDPVLTENMNRLKEEQAKLQEFAASLLATAIDDEEEEKNEVDDEEDMVASAFVEFKTKPEVRKEAEVQEPAAESAEEVLKRDVSEGPTSVESTSETIPPKVQTHVEDEMQEVQQVQQVQQPPTKPAPTPEEVQIDPPAELEPAEMLVEASEVKPLIPEEGEKVQAAPDQTPEEAPPTSASAPPPENSPKTVSSSCSEAKKQNGKKKKKRSVKNASKS